jgi:MscS family membrane protein
MDEFLLSSLHISDYIKISDFRFLVDVVVFTAVAILFFKFITVFFRRAKTRLKEKGSSLVRFLPAFERTIKGLVFFFLAATFLQSHGYSMASIIAGFGITGLAVGFAAKETIANIFGAIAILSDKSFQLGDCVEINGIEGTVEDINMRSTKLRAIDNSVVIMPNSVVASSVIKNITQIKRRRIFETVSIVRDTKKIARAVEIIEEIFENHADILPGYFAFVEKVSGNCAEIKMSAYLKTNDGLKYSKIKEQVLLGIIEKYRKEKIELAAPTVHIAK